MKNKAFLLAVLCAAVGGVTPVAGKIALETIPSFSLLFLRFLAATLFLLPFIIKRKDLSLKTFKKLWITGLVGALNPVIFFLALPHTQASISPLIYACVPALTALYVYFVHGKHVSLKQITGILLGLSGVAIIIFAPLMSAVRDFSTFKGNFFVFIAAITFMYYGIISKRYQTKHNISPLTLTFYLCVTSLIAIIPFTLWELSNETTIASLTETTSRHVIAAITTGIVGSGLFYLVYQWAISAGSSLTATLFTYMQPVSTIILASLFLNEKIGLTFVIGGILAIIGSQVAKD